MKDNTCASFYVERDWATDVWVVLHNQTEYGYAICDDEQSALECAAALNAQLLVANQPRVAPSGFYADCDDKGIGWCVLHRETEHTYALCADGDSARACAAVMNALAHSCKFPRRS